MYYHSLIRIPKLLIHLVHCQSSTLKPKLVTKKCPWLVSRDCYQSPLFLCLVLPCLEANCLSVMENFFHLDITAICRATAAMLISRVMSSFSHFFLLDTKFVRVKGILFFNVISKFLSHTPGLMEVSGWFMKCWLFFNQSFASMGDIQFWVIAYL